MELEDEIRRKKIKGGCCTIASPLSKWKQLAMGLEMQASCISNTQDFSAQHGWLLFLPLPPSFS